MKNSRILIALCAAALMGALATGDAVTLSAQRGGAAAAAGNAGPFGALRWRSLGPPRGGRSIAVEGSAARPYEYYMGATGGGGWESTGGGASRRPGTHTLLSSSSLGAVGLPPPHPGTLQI